ncbi:cytochrome P450 [Mycena albidolilacea]|uniref:Cytochrome P450 n=1 Tax=Mycena albidolilacea TaxID=1033008 RepID=A0AAD7EP83_9AGAR|nr:cytochrome P450 [Mycena albidolilacea]
MCLLPVSFDLLCSHHQPSMTRLSSRDSRFRHSIKPGTCSSCGSSTYDMRFLLDSLSVLVVIWIAYTLYRRWTRISISDIPGPEPESFLLGSQREALQCQAGEADFKWQAQFGHVIRLKGILGTDHLLISDPKALHYMYSSGYNIRKHAVRSEITRLATGEGLAWANNDVHKRQRRVNSPAFGTAEARSYVPIFTAYANLATKWKECLGVDGSTVVNAPNFFTRYFLDVIGEVAFDYRFGAINDEHDPLSTALSSITPMLSVPGKSRIFIMGLLEILPVSLIRFFIDYAPFKGFRNGRRVARLAKGIAKELVEEKAEALLAGKSKRDIMSLLVKANASANERANLSETEMLAQMQTIMLAGHETTATTMSWTLFELTKHPDMQAKLRAEIQATESAIHTRGDTEFTAADFESMAYTTAVMKEVLRFHPVSYTSLREAARDEILPLSKPLVTKSGKTIIELPIAKHTVLVVSLAGYNRNKDVFGEDADKFNPERWLDGSLQDKATTKLGVYGNLMTFGSGHRACIGIQHGHSVYEYQAFLVELVKNFEFSIDPTLASKIRREASLVMVPTIAGEIELGSQLPVTIQAVDSL